MSSPRTIKVAAAQLQAFGLDQADQSMASIERAIRKAAQAEVDLLALPECAYPAYLIRSMEAYRSADVLLPTEYLITLARLARKNKMHIVSGYVEDVGTHLCNSAVLIDGRGQEVGTYRKSFLWAADHRYFKPGDRVPVFQTELGKIAMVICADARAPEIIAKQVIDGAQVIAMPTCWVNVAKQPGCYDNPQPEYLISARAREFDVPFVCANKYGMESDRVGYCGRSIIASRTGELLAEAPGDEETLIIHEIELPDRVPDTAHSRLWESVVSWKEPIRPVPKVTAPVAVAVWPGGPIGGAGLEWAVSQGVRLLLANGPADDGAVLESGMDVVWPAHIGAVREVNIGKIGCVHGNDFEHFDVVRLLALAGAEIVCVFDAPDDLNLIRTRALENRIFILAVSEQIGAIASPGGEVLAYSSVPDDQGVLVEINIAEAAVKKVAPGTDIWEQRRVEAYK